jgi:RNA polymerase sigma factor (sigma-70 family)
MEYSKRVENFEKIRTEYAGLLTSLLWKLTGDRELFAEALQYALLAMWRHVEKLDGSRAAGYIYKIALSANSKAWRNRIGKDGQKGLYQFDIHAKESDETNNPDLFKQLRKSIAQLPAKQATAIAMRYLQQHGYTSIAEKLRCSEAAARSHVSKALATLKKKFNNSKNEVQ